MARMKVVRFEDLRRDAEHFPYTADDLAQHMLDVIDELKEPDIHESSSDEEEEISIPSFSQELRGIDLGDIPSRQGGYFRSV